MEIPIKSRFGNFYIAKEKLHERVNAFKTNYNDVFYTNNKRKFYPKTETFNHIDNTILIKLIKSMYRGGRGQNELNVFKRAYWRSGNAKRPNL